MGGNKANIMLRVNYSGEARYTEKVDQYCSVGLLWVGENTGTHMIGKLKKDHK